MKCYTQRVRCKCKMCSYTQIVILLSNYINVAEINTRLGFNSIGVNADNETKKYIHQFEIRRCICKI